MSESTTIIKFVCDGEKKSDAVGRARVEGRERTSEAPGQAVAWGGLNRRGVEVDPGWLPDPNINF